VGEPAFESKRFEIVRRIGQGGMGIVYEAIDRERGGARVAVKTLRNANAEHLLRLKREFRVMQEVQHPNLVALRELVCEDERWFLAMDLVEGVDFLEYVRAPVLALATEGAPSSRRDQHPETDPTLPIVRQHEAPVFDEPRLRDALRQLAEGLVALHAAGMVHRDIKPSNVLVTREGRVVLLDFGLVAETLTGNSSTAMVGTPTYMAPEQAAAGEPGPEADWYAMGVLLYEALTARLPFEGAALQVMLRKQNETPPPPNAVAVGVPEDLDALCNALLRFTPRERPTGGAVLRQLGSAKGAAGARNSGSASRTLAPPFVGRAQEMELLATALHDSRTEGLAVTIEGESGVGKSRLVRRFCERLALEDPQAVALAGRCYESESVPYKAFDGVVDALAKLLARLPDSQARELVPTRPAPLVQVFPVLRRVPAIADLVRTAPPQLDPFELRSRAFAALREMLVRLGDRRALVVVIDDAQWADHDSLALLGELTRPPEPPRMLLVATIRTAGGGARGKPRTTTLDRLSVTMGGGTRKVVLGPLSAEESRALVTELAERAGAVAPRPADIEAIANEAAGYPLFIDVLARQGGASEGKIRSASRLDDALVAQVDALDEDARKVVEVVSVAGEPLAQRVIARALDLSPDAFVRTVQRLRVGRLVATAGVRDGDRIEPYHDKIAGAIYGRMSAKRRKRISRAIARSLEVDPEADPEALARHWWDAGDPDQASLCSVRAGDRAASALAFDRAAGFYEQAVVLADESVDPEVTGVLRDRRKLLLKLAESLANAGRGKRAAEVFKRAAEGAAKAEALDLRRRAADQLLRSGHLDEGVSALERVLADVGIGLPRTPLGATVYYVFFRLLLLLRGLSYRARDTTELSSEALVRADACWSAAHGLMPSESLRAAAIQARSVMVALKLGDPYRIALVISAWCWSVATSGGRAQQQIERLMLRAGEAAKKSGEFHAHAWVVASRGVADYLQGRWRPGLEGLDRARDMLAQCVGTVWEIDSTFWFAINCLAQLGDLRDLAQRSSSYLREAGDRGDLYATVNLRIGFANLRWLIADDPDEARKQLDDAMGQWSKRGFHLVHFYELLARTNLDLYLSEPRRALDRVNERWGAMQRSLLPWKIQSVRIYSWNFRGRASLACAAQGGPDREALLRSVLADARRIERERIQSATPLAKLMRAGVARVRAAAAPEHRRAREIATATALVRKAAAEFDAVDMVLHATVCRRAMGEMIGGEEGQRLVKAADAWFSEQTVKRPAGFMAMVAPGLP
jgi:serine/threonine protein kinase